jgi:hypothetical protein
LQSRSRVDGVAEDHPLSLRPHFDRGVARQYPGTQAEVRHPHLSGQGRNSLYQRERRPDRALGVILARHRRAPHRHHRVADELLHGAAVAFDDGAAAVEVMAQKLPYLLGIAVLGKPRKAD